MQMIGDLLIRFGLLYQIYDLFLAKAEIAPEGPDLTFWPSTSLTDPFCAAAAEVHSATRAIS
jgi:hypothetical protein